MSFSPVDLLRVLAEHDVCFIVVGGIAARLNGAPLVTADVDVLYALDDANVERLGRAVVALDGVFRERPELRPDRSHLESKGHKLLRTRFGRLDLLGHVSPDLVYSDLVTQTTEVSVGGSTQVLVASLPALIDIKRACGRPKDLAALPLLEATLEERSR